MERAYLASYVGQRNAHQICQLLLILANLVSQAYMKRPRYDRRLIHLADLQLPVHRVLLPFPIQGQRTAVGLVQSVIAADAKSADCGLASTVLAIL